MGILDFFKRTKITSETNELDETKNNIDALNKKMESQCYELQLILESHAKLIDTKLTILHNITKEEKKSLEWLNELNSSNVLNINQDFRKIALDTYNKHISNISKYKNEINSILDSINSIELKIQLNKDLITATNEEIAIVKYKFNLLKANLNASVTK